MNIHTRNITMGAAVASISNPATLVTELQNDMGTIPTGKPL